MSTILITGIGGFVGSHVLEYLIAKTDWQIVGIDSFRHKGTYSRIYDSIPSNRVKILNHDLTVPIDTVLQQKIGHVDYILNLAANSAVERSIHDPVECLRNNFEIGLNVAEYARKVKPNIFIQMGTDEEYGDVPADKPPHTETSPTRPSNPYAASKSCQTSIAFSYGRSYSIPTLILRCMNLIATRQDPEKFLPRLISTIKNDKPVFIYSDTNGNLGSRTYLYVDNFSHAVVFLIDKLKDYFKLFSNTPIIMNIAGEREYNNLEFAQLVAKCIGKPNFEYTIGYPKSARPGYDSRYCLDDGFIRTFGWNSPFSTEEAVKRIVKWSLDNPEWLES